MERNGYVANCPEAFARYLNTPAFHAEVNRQKPSPEEAIELIHGAGGKAVLAHPGLLKKNWYEVEMFIKTLKEAGLDGVECIYQKHTPATEKRFLEIAKRYDLATSCGSDFHGVHVKPDVPLGMEINVERCKDVELCVTMPERS
jgi:predicted metal-dependent phosphoesterase TrpH